MTRQPPAAGRQVYIDFRTNGDRDDSGREDRVNSANDAAPIRYDPGGGRSADAQEKACYLDIVFSRTDVAELWSSPGRCSNGSGVSFALYVS